MSDNPSQNPPDASGAYPPQQPAYNPAIYPPAPQYESAAPQYPGQYAAAPYPYAQQKTNTLAIVSLIFSLLGIVWILPFVGSLVGVITGHMSLNQLKSRDEKGRGLALAGTIVGWVGLAFTIIFGIIIILVIVYSAQNSVRYGT